MRPTRSWLWPRLCVALPRRSPWLFTDELLTALTLSFLMPVRPCCAAVPRPCRALHQAVQLRAPRYTCVTFQPEPGALVLLSVERRARRVHLGWSVQQLYDVTTLAPQRLSQPSSVASRSRVWYTGVHPECKPRSRAGRAGLPGVALRKSLGLRMRRIMHPSCCQDLPAVSLCPGRSPEL